MCKFLSISGVGVGRFGDSDARNFSRPMVPDVLVQEGSCKAAGNWADEVDHDLAEVLGELGVTDDAFD
jgi:hypothetical protein